MEATAMVSAVSGLATMFRAGGMAAVAELLKVPAWVASGARGFVPGAGKIIGCGQSSSGCPRAGY